MAQGAVLAQAVAQDVSDALCKHLRFNLRLLWHING